MAACLQGIPLFRTAQAGDGRMLACDMPELHRQAAAGSTGFELLMGYGKVVHALLASGAELSEDLQVWCVAQLRVFQGFSHT